MKRTARQARCRLTNGTHFSQLGRLEEGCGRCLRTRVAGRMEEEMTVVMKGSLIVGLERPPWPEQAQFPRTVTGLRLARSCLGLADGALLAQLGPAPRLARLFVVFSLPQLFLNAAALEQLL